MKGGTKGKRGQAINYILSPRRQEASATAAKSTSCVCVCVPLAPPRSYRYMPEPHISAYFKQYDIRHIAFMQRE